MSTSEEFTISRPPAVYPISDGCALQGAQMVAHWIDGCVPLLHASPGCGFNFDFTGSLLAGQQSGPRWGGYVTPGTELVEMDVVFGGEEKLYNELIHVPKIYKDLEIIAVLTGCTADIIADDVERVIKRAEPEMNGIKVIYASTGGYRGKASFGANQTLNSICKNLVKEPEKKREKCINIMGITPYWDPYWIGERMEIKRICNLLGIEINAILPGECNLRSIEKMSEASLNIVLSDYIGIPAAKILEERFELPYLSAYKGVPIGAQGTKDFFMEIARCLSMDLKQAENILDQEAQEFYEILQLHAESWVWFGNMSYAIIAHSAKAIGMVRFLTGELDYLPEMIAITSYGEESESNLRAVLNEIVPKSSIIQDAKIMMDPHTLAIRETLEELKPNIILGRSVDREVAMHVEGYHPLCVPITYPVTDRFILTRGYVGFRGALTLVEDIHSALGGMF